MGERLESEAAAKEKALKQQHVKEKALTQKALKQQEELSRMASELETIKGNMGAVGSLAESTLAVEKAISTNDQELLEKMEAMEAELTNMLCKLHLKKEMMF